MNKDQHAAGVVHFAMVALDNMMPESASAAKTVKKVGAANKKEKYAQRVIEYYLSRV